MDWWDAPDAAALRAAEAAIVSEGLRACGEVLARPPVARPAAERCQRCDVRGWCGPYWTVVHPALPPAEAGRTDFHARVEIVRNEGTEVVARAVGSSGGRVVLLLPRRDAAASAVTPGSTLRVTGALRVSEEAAPGDDSLPVYQAPPGGILLAGAHGPEQIP